MKEKTPKQLKKSGTQFPSWKSLIKPASAKGFGVGELTFCVLEAAASALASGFLTFFLPRVAGKITGLAHS